MPEAIGHGPAQAFPPTLGQPRTEKVAQQAEAARARQSEAAAETVQRQANFSSNRAELLSEQAEKLEKRAENRNVDDGLGRYVDISV
ncbi:hypothetical protein [Roseibium aggregatum]|uniref:Uncharacterized protein n=1 Tax=Roseibium aggregatum TaxID=187304 RepID=A0A939J6X3_9HYPH|nr:hypothetical protein [Roseibium aggregatum]MBN9673229.1 hypothetical protein [Roseibium aggregatum]